MSRNRRESHGLGRIFSQPETQPTPYKQAPLMARSAKKASRQPSLHDPIWDAPTGKVLQTPGQRNMRPNRTPTQRHGDGELLDMAGNVYQFLSAAGFEAQTGGSIPNNPALTPMNADILKMFTFLFEIVDPGHGTTPILTMLEDLGYTHIDQAFRRTFSNSHILANTATIWPKILKALSHVLGIIQASRTGLIPKCTKEEDQLRLLQEEYVYSKFCGYDTKISEETIKKFLATVDEQVKATEGDINRIQTAISATQKANDKYLTAKSEQEKVKEDEQNLQQFMIRVQAQVASYEQQFDKLNMELITAQETLARLESQKNRYAHQFEQAGVSVAKLEDYRYQQKSHQEDLIRIKDRITDLELQTKSKWEKVTHYRAKTKIVLEKVCEELGTAVPEQEEWSSAVIEMFSTLDGQRRDLVIKSATIQESIINDKVVGAAFNSQFDNMQAKQVRLEVVAKSIEEKNEFQVRELEIKTTIINQRVDAMKKHCQRLLCESEKEHNLTRAQRLELEKEAAKLDSEAILSIQTITSQTRNKIRRLDSVQTALLPGIRQLGSSAHGYSKLASDITKRAMNFKTPEAKKHQGTKKDQIDALLKKLNRAIADSIA